MAVVDLSRPLGVDLIVVRGCRDRCVVETSTDLRAWRLVGSTDAERAAFPVASRWPARYVRVSSPFIDDITEISAWSGRPRLPDASLLVAPNRFPTASGGASSASPGRTKPSGFGWWAVVAAALIGSVVGATAMLLARKRRLPA
jgi:hypothetical protein